MLFMGANYLESIILLLIMNDYLRDENGTDLSPVNFEVMVESDLRWQESIELRRTLRP